MNKGRTVLGLCVAAALLVSAFAAQGASAETTEFTCSKEVTTKTWSDAHCTNSSTGTKEYGHVAIPENTTTDAIGGAGTSKATQRLRATINGINTEIVSTSVSGSGSMKNTTVGGKMQVIGTGTSTLTNVTVAAPAGKGCKVYTDNGGVKGEEGVIHTNELKVVTTEEMGLKTEPASGETFATFFIEGCAGSEALEGLNKTYSITGSVIGVPNGGEGIFEHANTTAQNTLKLNGTIKAGIDGSGTLKARHAEKPEEEYKAITVTTPPYITD
jgi:hypothetical protein